MMSMLLVSIGTLDGCGDGLVYEGGGEGVEVVLAMAVLVNAAELEFTDRACLKMFLNAISSRSLASN
jgi:hypothetical protein